MRFVNLYPHVHKMNVENVGATWMFTNPDEYHEVNEKIKFFKQFTFTKIGI